MSPISVIVADDHPVVRDGIRRLLNEAVGIEVVGEAGDGAEALEMTKNLKPDILLLDMELPVMSGDEVAQKIIESGADVRILVLSAHDDREYIQQLLAKGAAGYLMKEEFLRISSKQCVARGERLGQPLRQRKCLPGWRTTITGRCLYLHGRSKYCEES
jgi:DNA-binding NarL/FixJ family response regulator